MTPADAAWHLLNALAAPFWVAVLTSLVAKLVWRRQLSTFGLKRLILWTSTAGVVGYGSCWALLGVEGSVLGYSVTLAAVAVVCWSVAFLVRRHHR